MHADAYLTFDDLLFRKVAALGNRTLAQAYLRTNWPFAKKRQYVGDWDDLEQTLLCGLVEWYRGLGSPERVLQSGAFAQLDVIFNEELDRNCRKERLGEPSVDQDGNWQHWNPTEPEDLTDERAKALSSVIEGFGKLVGEAAAYIIKARILHNLSWEKISYRLNHVHPRKGEPQDYRIRKMEGYHTQGAIVLSPQEVETLFLTSIEKVRAKANSGDWESWEKLLKPKKESNE